MEDIMKVLIFISSFIMATQFAFSHSYTVKKSLNINGSERNGLVLGDKLKDLFMEGPEIELAIDHSFCADNPELITAPYDMHSSNPFITFNVGSKAKVFFKQVRFIQNGTAMDGQKILRLSWHSFPDELLSVDGKKGCMMKFVAVKTKKTQKEWNKFVDQFLTVDPISVNSGEIK
jgi:hypothetical protein